MIQDGIATAIGEQPIKGLVDASAGARMAVAEAITNLVFARISDIQVLDDIIYQVACRNLMSELVGSSVNSYDLYLRGSLIPHAYDSDCEFSWLISLPPRIVPKISLKPISFSSLSVYYLWIIVSFDASSFNLKC